MQSGTCSERRGGSVTDDRNVTDDRDISRGRQLRRSTTPRGAWRGGRLNSPDRRLVLLACADFDSNELRRWWTGQRIDVETCADLALALLRVGQLEPDLVVIGEFEGMIQPVDFVRTIRRSGAEVPVVLGLTDLDPAVVSAALVAGATAVVRRPFSPESLLRLLRDSASVASFQVKPLPIDLGRLRVDGAATRIWVDGVESLLPAMEHLLVRYLAERHRQIVSRDELIAVAWGTKDSLASNSLAVHMARLRRRFPVSSGQEWIRSVRGCGYQMVVSTPLLSPGAAAG